MPQIPRTLRGFREGEIPSLSATIFTHGAAASVSGSDMGRIRRWPCSAGFSPEADCLLSGARRDEADANPGQRLRPLPTLPGRSVEPVGCSESDIHAGVPVTQVRTDIRHRGGR